MERDCFVCGESLHDDHEGEYGNWLGHTVHSVCLQWAERQEDSTRWQARVSTHQLATLLGVEDEPLLDDDRDLITQGWD